jgi:hypothetical protein
VALLRGLNLRVLGQQGNRKGEAMRAVLSLLRYGLEVCSAEAGISLSDALRGSEGGLFNRGMIGTLSDER